MSEKTVLVTGGAGYVGSHTCKALAQAGYHPVVYDNLNRGHREFVKWGPLEEGDIRDRGRLQAVIDRHKPSSVMHFAALALVGESTSDPLAYYDTNIGGTMVLTAALCENEIEKLVFSGTCAVYGIPVQTPIAESAAVAPINPYGRSKLAAEDVVRDVGSRGKFSSTIFRYFNAAGADEDCEIGEKHDPETHIIPNVLRVATGELPTLSLYGDDYATADGTCIRDYVHVSDIADAHVTALDYMDKTPGAHVFNLGTGQGHSVKEIIRTAADITQEDIDVRVEARRDGDPPVLVADATRAAKELKWTPVKSSLNSLISDAWAWHQKNGF